MGSARRGASAAHVRAARRRSCFVRLGLPVSVMDGLTGHSAGLQFSDHHLNEVLPNTAEWRKGSDDPRATLEQMRVVFAAFTPSTNEAQTEEERQWRT